jgi:hypothetical protein
MRYVVGKTLGGRNEKEQEEVGIENKKSGVVGKVGLVETREETSHSHTLHCRNVSYVDFAYLPLRLVDGVAEHRQPRTQSHSLTL